MEAAPRPVSPDGLGKFLVEHESCNAGFDVEHPAGLGNGLISMTCRGCGKTYDYAAGAVEIEREIEFEPVPAQVVSPPPPPLPKKPKAKTANRGQDRIVVATLLLLALGAIAFAVIRVMNEREGTATSEPATPATAPAPEPEQPAASQPQQKPAQPQKPAQQQQQQQTSQAPQAAGGLETDEKLMRLRRYSLIVPDPWTQRQFEGGTLIGPPGTSPVSVQVFFEDGSTSDVGTMAKQSVEFGQSRVGGKQVGETRRTSVDGDPAFELTVRGPEGSRAMLGVLSGSTSYLVVGNIGNGASSAQEADVRRALKIFRPEAG